MVSESPDPPRRLFTDLDDVRKVSTLTTPTGPVGVFPFLDVETNELLRSSDRIVALHGVQDPGNVGTIIRAAHAFGAGVALSRRSADLYNPKTVRATMGSIFHAPIAREVDTVEFLSEASSLGFTTVAALPEAGESPRSLPDGRLVLVVGTEGSGLPEEVISACGGAVTIPSQAASLNVAVAASILLYEAYMRVLP
ncbi:MAG: TrmH family RNA methyltransferase [Rubrobacteraceae bacterium]